MTWGDLPFLYLLTLVPLLVAAYALDGQRRRRLYERIGHLPMIQRMTASFSPGRRRARAILSVFAVALLVLAMGRPQMPGRAKLTESRGLDLVVALDFSKSMLARDVYPTRLDRAKAELSRFIDSLHGDRVGLVAFAGETMSYPLTVDYEAAKLFWRDLQPDDMPVGGTDIGRALRASIDLLTRVREREGKKRPAQVILLITDGEDTEGLGLAAAKKAATLGIRIFTLGIGSNEKPPVPLFDEDGKQHGYVSDDNGDPVRVGLDESALKQMAALTGGEYTPLDQSRFGVERVQSAIAQLERTEEAARFEREPDDVGRWFLLPAFLMLLLSSCLRERRSKTAPLATVASDAPAANAPASRFAPEPSQRVLAALILFLALPMLTGFDLLKRKDPNIEEGNRLLQAGKAEDALKSFDRAVETLPGEPIAHYDRGVALYQLGKFPEAQKEFLRASEEGHDPGLKADAYYNMGNSLLKQKRAKDALDAYKHTLGLRPDDRRAKWNLELALRQMLEQQKQQQQQDNKDNKDNKDQKDDKQQQQQQQQQAQDQKSDDKQKQSQADEQKDQQKQTDEQKAEEQKQAEEQKKQDQQQPQPSDKDKEKEKEKQAQRAQKKEQPREIDKQDAEAVLDALERSEPTVQKDLARRRAETRRRPAKDW
jgi:Ca-activated chloride channel family protein